MTIRRQTTIEIVPLFFIAAAIGAVFAFYNSNKHFSPTRVTLPVIENIQKPSPAPTVTVIPTPQISNQISPDGSEKLTLAATANKDFSKSYTFTTSHIDDTNPKTIYSKTLNIDSMNIPFNTWSPDNQYVFFTIASSSGTESIVMKANGDPITNTEDTINLTSLFREKYPDKIYDETTGWASNTLLIINTKKEDGTKGLSFWFEVPSKAIIPLSIQF